MRKRKQNFFYKFGILKYLIADKNEIGSTLFSILNKENNQILIPTGYLTGKKKVEIQFYLIH